MREEWGNAPSVELPIFRPACPLCGCEEYTLKRCEANGDGTTTRKAICVGCDGKFLIIANPQPLPLNGNWEFDND